MQADAGIVYQDADRADQQRDVGGEPGTGVFVSDVELVAARLAARLDDHLQQTLLHALPFVILAALFLKITLAIAGLTLSLRHKAISTKSAAGIAAGWFLCSLLVALYTRYFCQTLHRPDLTAWTIAASFLALPLTRLSFAPVALSWNRHR